MSVALALVLAASLAPTPPVTLQGACIYPPSIGEPGGDRSFVQCDTVATDAGGVEFRQSAWDARFRYEGTWQGGILRVTSLRPRTGKSTPARGTCRVYLTDKQISTISCLAVVNGRSWVANFRAAQ
jgi:hypothetical protein